MSTSPPSAGLKKCVLNVRSNCARFAASITDGIAKMIIIDATSDDHTKAGIRRSDMPGARILRITVARSTATIRPIASVRLIRLFQTSARLPMPYWGPASGTYENQPASAPVLMAKPVHSDSAPSRYSQYAQAVIRGNAVLRVPTLSGTR